MAKKSHYLLLITLCVITLSHAADESTKAFIVTPETSLTGSDAPNPLLTINTTTATLLDHVQRETFPKGLALVYDRGTLTGATAAYHRVTKARWQELADAKQKHFHECLTNGQWALLSLQALSRNFSHCLYLGSNDKFDAMSKICGLSWS